MAGVALKLLVLKTRQVERLRQFYQTIGIEMIEEKHGDGPTHYAGRVGDIVLEVYPLTVSGSAADATVRLGFVVEELTEVVRALQSSGAAIINEPRQTAWGCRAVVRDPDGRAVELYEKEMA